MSSLRCPRGARPQVRKFFQFTVFEIIFRHGLTSTFAATLTLWQAAAPPRFDQ